MTPFLDAQAAQETNAMAIRELQEADLVGGPQDGGRVRRGGGSLPTAVHVGPKWLGDGYAAWSDEACARFPARYEWSPERGAFVFARWDKGNEA